MAHRKISKQGGAAVTDLEDKVARALLELEASVSDLKESLTDLYFVAAKVCIPHPTISIQHCVCLHVMHLVGCNHVVFVSGVKGEMPRL